MQVPQLETPSEKEIITHVCPRLMFFLVPARSEIDFPQLVLLDTEPL